MLVRKSPWLIPGKQPAIRDSMRTGIHALASFDLSPALPEDLAALGLHDCAVEAPGIGLHARLSDMEQIGSAAVARDGDSWCYFLGEFEDPGTVAAPLGCDRSPAAIALAAVRCWGAQTTDRLAGQWSLLYWDARERALWLGASRMLRDRLYFAFDGQRVAVSSDFSRLGSVGWIGAAFDPLGVAYALSRSAVRVRRAGRSLFKNILELEAGAFHRFAAGGDHSVFHPAPDAALNWEGDFEEAIAAIEARLASVFRALLAPHDCVAVMLSGGLDSAVVARFMAQARGPDQTVIALTAAAPPESGMQDERLLAGAVADAFGMEQRLVWPDERASIFRPARPDTADGNLGLSPRHYLFDALLTTARQLGATAVFDGVGGEMSVSAAPIPHSRRVRLAAIKSWVFEHLARGRAGRTEIERAFQIPPSRSLLETLPSDFVTPPHRLISGLRPHRACDRIGLRPGYHKLWRTPTTVGHGGLRHMSPLRDRHLIRMVAGMPSDFTARHGQDRALARALLRGHVPDAVTCQTKGLAFSVDYPDRFRRELPQVLERMPAWREARVDEWLDLDWIAREVSALTNQASIPTAAQFRLLMAVLAAEALLRRRPLVDEGA
jgi:asparagine synthase (glutamine-hydrolysing)